MEPLPTELFCLLAETKAKGTWKSMSRLPQSQALCRELLRRQHLPAAPCSCPSTSTAPGTTVPPMLSHSPEHPIRCPTQSPLSFLSSLLLPPCGFFSPRSCFQGERGQRCWNERFSCVPSPSSGPNSFFMAPCSDKSRCFSLVSVSHAISQS